MATEVIMPKAGMAMEEGTVIKWLKEEGDKVEKGEAILEILTDKVNMEVEAEVGGILLKTIAKEGEVLPVFSTIAYIGEEGEKIPDAYEETKKRNEGKHVTPKENQIKETQREEISFSNTKIRATPAARRAAREKHIELSQIRGTGPKGRIQLCDVESFREIEKSRKRSTPLAANIAKAQGINIEDIEGSGFKNKVLKADVEKYLSHEKNLREEEDKIIPLTGMRKVIGSRMRDSYFTAPTFTLNIDVDMTNVKALRNEVKDSIFNETGNKITFTDIIIMAVSKALMKYPIVNASLVEEGILLHNYVNIGLAVGLDEGLLVPVIRDTHKKSLSEIVNSTKDVIERTKNNKLLPDEMEKSTFTISNLGMFGITHFNPIINQPNSAILGVNTITDKMVVINKKPDIRPIMCLSLTVDHRVIDGAPGAKFLQYLKDLLENPMKLLI
ncbi:2-oxo acid dehydrogenase subunit E2 [Maledivibacter halophilus]|uniref:Dihydrolipoamide acetyltransferase component of pyruvate dehydrogenase complex n=1 Tax=Maledivibacter halophilus TaxID=36842 RepID=A0A1T5MHZ9_9FIRM|nr:2-oxo acid dehydrogenase subunit E2 [Maledivibacter halophilus]SKC87857.1 pyruvate dehydrogenase E2 component (dihydrolipoamide acetyltransferase) [Maledivibacter halophilus]